MAEKLKKIIGAGEIRTRVRELAGEINGFYGDQPLVCVCVLKGAFIFFADLLRRLRGQPVVEFVRLASYGQGTRPGDLCFTKDLEVPVQGKNVLIVEDIVDTGLSMQYLKAVLAGREPLSLKICALIDKVERRVTDLTVDFTGFRLNKGFLVGYGMDCAERHRRLNAIYELLGP
ncbi:MAG: hypoxanthine phosphoribosyltransferase [Desulfovibrionaceae bacterium]|nr:hypoxanthine phosphoribosyltransferase [Desulfovibrionaceae bacterium]